MGREVSIMGLSQSDHLGRGTSMGNKVLALLGKVRGLSGPALGWEVRSRTLKGDIMITFLLMGTLGNMLLKWTLE